jgi:hypothetical protein
MNWVRHRIDVFDVAYIHQQYESLRLCALYCFGFNEAAVAVGEYTISTSHHHPYVAYMSSNRNALNNILETTDTTSSRYFTVASLFVLSRDRTYPSRKGSYAFLGFEEIWTCYTDFTRQHQSIMVSGFRLLLLMADGPCCSSLVLSS